MSERAQDVLAKALLDTPGVCADAGAVAEAPSLQCAWQGSLDYALDANLWWWFIGAFESVEDTRRIRAAADEIRSVFLDLAKLNYCITGQPSQLPEPLIRCLEMRLAHAMRPSARSIATGATRAPFGRVSAQLKTLTTEASWRTRSES